MLAYMRILHKMPITLYQMGISACHRMLHLLKTWKRRGVLHNENGTKSRRAPQKSNVSSLSYWIHVGDLDGASYGFLLQSTTDYCSVTVSFRLSWGILSRWAWNKPPEAFQLKPKAKLDFSKMMIYYNHISLYISFKQFAERLCDLGVIFNLGYKIVQGVQYFKLE